MGEKTNLENKTENREWTPMNANSKMQRWIITCSLMLAGCSHLSRDSSLPKNEDAVFRRIADEYIAGYLTWRPLTGTSLGLHQYDGKITDYSRSSLDAELQRLKSFDQKLAGLNTHR